ncbi:MAG: hypothetical protein KBS68_07785 [Clostridiales bacterium]|nr:hypothetical protein [Candidatus Crickella merdequi]
MVKIVDKYASSRSEADVTFDLNARWRALSVVKIEINHITGKQSIELV